MLDEEEFAVVRNLYRESFRATKEFRLRYGVPIQCASIEQRFRPVREAYERITGIKDCHENAIMHHRIALYGEPCKRC